MTDIRTTFCGLKLESPIVAASAPPTESVQAIVQCAKAGVGAIVTKSAVDYRRADVPSSPRRTLRHPNGQWSIQGSFGSETLTLQEALVLHRAVRLEVDIPIISSVGYLGGDPQMTVELCCRLAEAGSSMIHLDLFYTPHPRASDAALAALRELVLTLKRSCPLPITAKLNLDYPAHLMADHGALEALDGVFLLDSVRTPIARDDRGFGTIPNLAGAAECSLFGTWQKPLTLQYTRVLAKATSKDICSGGGLQNAVDILQAIELGAAATQFATPIMVHGARWISRTNDELREQLAKRGFKSLREFKASTLLPPVNTEVEQVVPVRAEVDPETCIKCDVCTRLMFCGFIDGKPGELPEISKECTGCGFCVPLCPTRPKSIRLVPTATAFAVQPV